LKNRTKQSHKHSPITPQEPYIVCGLWDRPAIEFLF